MRLGLGTLYPGDFRDTFHVCVFFVPGVLPKGQSPFILQKIYSSMEATAFGAPPMRIVLWRRSPASSFAGGGTAASIMLLLLTLCFRSSSHIEAFSASSTNNAAAATSPLFRACPPVEGPIDQVNSEYQVSSHPSISPLTTTTAATHPSQSNKHVNVRALQSLGYTTGLCQALVHASTHIYAKRYWIIDDSLSMTTKDGHFLMYTDTTSNDKDTLKTTVIEQVPCTRWNELQETVLQHAILSLHCDIPTDFRLLNTGTGHFRIPRTFQSASTKRGNGASSSSTSDTTDTSSMIDVQHAQKILTRSKPNGQTPLTARLCTVHNEIKQSILPKLSESQKKVAVVIATDGLPTNEHDHGLSTSAAKQDFKLALKALPWDTVSVVIRLCTDDVDVVSYYKELEAELPHVQVLDDYWAEASRVHTCNPWLNYGLALHRIREMGYCGNMPLLKSLSQRPLTQPEVAEFCAFLFGWTEWPKNSPNEAMDELSWDALHEAVDVSNDQQGLVWNPVSAQLEPWIELDLY